jgi:hypothetical protein
VRYRVFYYFERSGDSVSSVSAVEMSTREICDQLLGRLHEPDDFLGLLDAEGNVLQILREGGGDRYWVELPMDAAKASYGRHMCLAELQELLLGLTGIFDRRQIPGLRYKPW